MVEIADILLELKSQNRLRTVPHPSATPLFDLSSNDYLGLAKRAGEFREEFDARFSDAGFTSSASRLLSTQQDYHYRLEALLAELYGKEALLFNSGYHANVGCIGALTLPATLFVCDKLIHASVIDGLRISNAEFKRFPHNDIAKLESILEKEYGRYSRIIIVVESIYSMDGDQAPLHELAALKHRYPGVMLYVDEAHAFGVRGERGLGLCEQLGLIGCADIIIGTFGKAAASVGAFAIVDEELKSLFINTSRPFIFSTALPPVNVAWSLLMTEKIIGMQAERKALKQLSQFFAERIAVISRHKPDTAISGHVLPNIIFSSKELTEASQIIPYLTGSAERALAIASQLREAGILALPIRRPTVPPGGERIRFSLSADMTMQQLRRVADILEDIEAQTRRDMEPKTHVSIEDQIRGEINS